MLGRLSKAAIQRRQTDHSSLAPALSLLLDLWPLNGVSPPCLRQIRGAKKQANELKVGNVIEAADGRPCAVTKFEYIQGSGRQLGNVHLELRDVRGGRKVLERRRPYDMVETIRMESQEYQFLYAEGGQITVMHPETYEQLLLSPAMFGNQASLMKEGSTVTLNLMEGEVLSGELPTTVPLAVQEVEPYVAGDSATASMIGATLETGARILVPAYVQQGDTVIVNTQERAFVKRLS